MFFSYSVCRLPKILYTHFKNPSSVDIPPKKGLEIGTITALEIYRPVSVPFFGGISTEEGFLKSTMAF